MVHGDTKTDLGGQAAGGVEGDEAGAAGALLPLVALGALRQPLALPAVVAPVAEEDARQAVPVDEDEALHAVVVPVPVVVRVEGGRSRRGCQTLVAHTEPAVDALAEEVRVAHSTSHRSALPTDAPALYPAA